MGTIRKLFTGQKKEGFHKSILLVFSPILLLLLTVHARFLQRYFFTDDFWLLAFYRFADNSWDLVYPSLSIKLHYRPLGWLLIKLNYYLFDLNPFGYHLINFFLHFLNTILVFSLVNIFTKNIGRAFLAGTLFALHPVCTHSCVLFSWQDALLGVFFCLIAIWFWVKFRLKQENKFYLLALLFTVLSYFCKETMLILPLLVIAYDLSWGGERFDSARAKLVNAVKLYTPFFFLLVLFLGWRWHVLGGWGGYDFQRITLTTFFPQMSYHLPRLFYNVIYKMIYSNYSIMGKWRELIFAGFTLIFFLLMILFSQRRRFILNKEFSFGLMWILITIIPLITSTHLLSGVNGFGADRYLYLPMVGFSIFLISLLGKDSGNRKTITMILFSLLIGLYSLISIKENIIWKGRCDENKKIVSSMKNFIQEDPSRFLPGDIFYFLGMSKYSFYSDVMFKAVLPEAFHQYFFLLGDQLTFVWRFKRFDGLAGSKKISNLSEMVLLNDKKNSIELVLPPPDLLTISITDKNAYFFEYIPPGRFREITQNLRLLARKREELLRAGKYRKVLAWDFSRKEDFGQWELANQIILSVDQQDIGISPSPLKSTGEDPYLIGPEIRVPSLGVEKIEIRMRLPKLNYLPPPWKTGEIFWMTGDDPTWGGKKHLSFPIVADGKFHTYQVPVGGNIYWQMGGDISRLRLDPVRYPTRMQIDYISVIPYGE